MGDKRSRIGRPKGQVSAADRHRILAVWLLKVAPLAIGIPVMAWLTSVSPHDAKSNLVKWAHIFGIKHVPDWLSARQADHDVQVFGLLLAGLYITFIWIVPAIRFRNGQGRRYMTPYEVSDYLSYRSRWGVGKYTEKKIDHIEGQKVVLIKIPMMEAPEEFRLKAADGLVRVFGRSEHGSSHEEVPSSFWMSNQFDALTAINDMPGRSGPLPGVNHFERFEDLQIDRDDVRRVWPSATPIGHLRRHLAMKWRERMSRQA